MAITEIHARLDISSIVSGLAGQLGGPLATLQGLTSPVDAGAAATAELSVDVDAAALHGSLAGMLTGFEAKLVGATGVGDVVAPLSTALELVEQVTLHDLPGSVRALFAQIAVEFQGSGRPFLDLLLVAVERMFGSPELARILDLLGTAFRSAGISFRPAELTPDLLPSVARAVRGIGGLMSLESALAEAERLAAILCAQVDRPSIDAELAGLRGALTLDGSALAAALDAAAAGDATAVDAALEAIAAGRVRFAEVNELLRRAMGFAEATLVHLDLGQVNEDVARSIALLRDLDTGAVGRATGALRDRLKPLFDLDLGGGATAGIDALFDQLERKVDGVVTAIGAVPIDPLVAPLRAGLEAATGALSAATGLFDRVMDGARAALAVVEDAVSAIPLTPIRAAVDALLQPLRDALAAIADLVGGVQQALESAAQTATSAIESGEGVIDTFEQEVLDTLKDAADFLESLHLDQVVGGVADQVNGFASLLAQAQMKPYFDTASGVMDTAAGALEALPLSLLPDPVLAEVDQAVAPVRAIDAGAVKIEVMAWFAIEDGRFQLRGPLEASLADLKQKVDQLIVALEGRDPRAAVPLIDGELSKVRDALADVVPQIQLQPIQDAIARVRGALAGFDLRTALRPVSDAFAKATAAVDAFSPAALLAPLEQRVAAARQQIVDALKLDTWKPQLQAAVDQAKALLDRLEIEGLEKTLEQAMREAAARLEGAAGNGLAGSLGDLFAMLLAGDGQPRNAWTFEEVARWLGSGGGTADLTARANRILACLDAARRAVESLDLQQVRRDLAAQVAAIDAAAGSLAAGSDARTRVAEAVARMAFADELTAIEANRARFVADLASAAERMATLRATGFSQVDISATALREAFAPLLQLRDLLRRLPAQIGLSPLQGGVLDIARHLLARLDPARVAVLVTRLLDALKARIGGLLDAFLAPVLAAIDALAAALNAFDLKALRDALLAVQAAVKGRIAAIDPLQLLKPEIDAVDALRATLDGFDPLAPLQAVLDALKQAAERILGRLDGAALLAQPIRIYDEILAAVRALRIDDLLAPVFDQLDNLAAQIDGGLNGTCAAIGRLQAALPAPGAGGGVSVSVEVAVG